MIINDADSYREPIHRQFLKDANVRSELIVVVSTEGTRTGVIICSQFRGARRWESDEVLLIQAVSDQLAIAYSQANLYAHSRQQAIELARTLCQLENTQAQIIQTEKMSSLGRVAAGVAHEINNPISFIHANLIHSRTYIADLIEAICLYRRHCSDLPFDVQETIEELDIDFLKTDFPKLVDSMQVGTERIEEIVLSLRNFSRLDKAEFKLADIHDGIESTLVMVSEQITCHEIEIIKKYQPLPKIECYPGQINQVLLTLLVNAVDAIKEASYQASSHQVTSSHRIIISTAIDSESVTISVANTGLPIPRSIQSKIFDPFFTTKPVGQGTGMGLAIAHQIITQNHRGQLAFTTAPEQTVFTLKLPHSFY